MSAFPSAPGAPGRPGPLGDFGDPFVDVATLSMPKNHRNALRWCEYLWYQNGAVRSALGRVLSYFITDLEFDDREGEADDEEQEKWRGALVKTLKALVELQKAYCNMLVYGSALSSLIVPFKRFLLCPTRGCGTTVPVRHVQDNPAFRFEWSDLNFVATCFKCGRRGKWTIDDKPEDNERKLRVKHWNVHEMEIVEDEYTGNCEYLWRIPEDYKAQVRRGHGLHLEECPRPVLDAIRSGQTRFLFDPDVIYHMREPDLCGVKTRGWGLPRLLSNFRQIFYNQVLKRYNEAIALDYIIPFRVLSPAPRPGGAGGAGGAAGMNDPLLAFNAQDFASKALAMVRRRRRDPAGWNVFPFPINYQALGGDASKLAPVDMMAQGMDELLNALGVPASLYKGDLQLQTAPMAVRLFESIWVSLLTDGDGWLEWLAGQTARVMSWEPVVPTLRRPTVADDLQQTMMKLQLAASGQVSLTSALKPMDLDYRQETRRLANEAAFSAASQARVSQEMDDASFAQQMAKGNVGGAGGGQPGQPPGGGQPPAGGQGQQQPVGMPSPVDTFLASMPAGSKMSPEDMQAAAESIANDLLGRPESEKNKDLRRLKSVNATMHSVVRAAIDAKRKQARNAGGQQVLSQQYGGGQG